MTGDRVLIIDDEQEFTSALAERLRARGLTVETAASGQEALEIVQRLDFDAVLLDLAMPGWDGVETLKRLRKERPDIQVVLLTGHATVSKGIEVIKEGALDLVEKPAKIEELLVKIEEASAKKAVLVEERLGHDLEEIIRTKGW